MTTLPDWKKWLESRLVTQEVIDYVSDLLEAQATHYEQEKEEARKRIRKLLIIPDESKSLYEQGLSITEYPAYNQGIKDALASLSKEKHD